jgi:hypothetical protein
MKMGRQRRGEEIRKKAPRRKQCAMTKCREKEVKKCRRKLGEIEKKVTE